jgi:superfamily II DNA/RNA helicase
LIVLLFSFHSFLFFKGSGKTLAFLIPVVAALNAAKLQSDGAKEMIDGRGVVPKAIILAPTRELASQIHLDARRLLFNSGLKAVCVYGGNDIRNQLVELCTGSDCIVATPGRLNDLVDRGIVSLQAVTFLVLDEADRMLDMGFEVSLSFPSFIIGIDPLSLLFSLKFVELFLNTICHKVKSVRLLCFLQHFLPKFNH